MLFFVVFRSFCLLKCLLHFWQGLNLLWAWNFKCSSRLYWLLQTFSQVTHLIFLLGFSNFDLILAEYQFKLLNILVARQLSGFIRYFFFVWQCALLSLTRIFRAQKYKLRDYKFKPKLKLSVRSSYFNLEVRFSNFDLS